ncbi:MAG: alpha/beta fold hydrolase [Bacteroidia bacterium]
MLKKSSFQNAQLQWLDLGEGPCLLLLHGFTESYRCWEPFARALSANYRLIVPDLPGSGESALIAGAAGMDQMALSLWQLLNELDIDQCTVIGHSMGGYVALDMLEQAAHRLNGIGLFHSHPFGDDAAKQANRDRTIKLIEERGSKAFLQGFIPNLFAPQHRVPLKNTISQLEKQAARQSTEAYIAQSRGMRNRANRQHLLARTHLPKLVVAGAADPILPLEVALSFAAKLDRCQLEILQNAGHMGMYEQPDESAAVLSSFMQDFVGG